MQSIAFRLAVLAGGVDFAPISLNLAFRKSGDMITVFYDGQCGLCRGEIDYYRRIAPSGLFDWVDIAGNAMPLALLAFLSLLRCANYMPEMRRASGT